MNRCTATGCYEHVAPPQLFCPFHYRRLPEAVRQALGKPITDMIARATAVNDAIRYLSDAETRTYSHAS